MRTPNCISSEDANLVKRLEACHIILKVIKGAETIHDAV